MRQLFTAAMLSLLLFNADAQTTPKLITSVEGINEYELPNGLKILLIPDEAQTNVIVNIVYKVGSRHEGYGEKGMAHLLEHMLFKPSKKFTDIKKSIADKGAIANGTTWYDRTNYYEVLPGTDENLRWSLDMESDRMVNSKILQSDLEKEFSVVRNEFEMGENTSVYIFGGEAFPEERFIYWNFVATDKAMIEEAKERWIQQTFPKIPEETGFVPLPVPPKF